MKKVGHISEFPCGIYWRTLKNLKNQNFEKMRKTCWGIHHFTQVYQKPQSYEIQFLRYEVRQFFLSFWTNFCPLCPLPLTAQKTNFEHFKNASGDVIILNLCKKKTWSNDVCLFRYEVQQTFFFVILGHFFLFHSTIDPEN